MYQLCSAQEASERVFQAVQAALQPCCPKRATAWNAHWTIINLLKLDSDPSYPQVQDGYWREPLDYAVQDFAEFSAQRIILSDLPALLNAVRFTRGRGEAKELAHTLSRLRCLYPSVFAD